jgi:hypothetical protein
MLILLALQEQIARLESHSLVGSERKEVVDHLLGGISRLSIEVADVTESVPAYDQRVYSQVSRMQDSMTAMSDLLGDQRPPRETPRDSVQI